ncbi:MAG TPA: histidine kinase [Longimicrobiaceae bacterium]|nr:histidine kinase [Longimicrobiaceae bacterium]
MRDPARSHPVRPAAIRATAAGAVLFALGVAVGATLAGSPVQARIPARSDTPWRDLLRVLGPGTVPLYAAVLAFPLFLLLARRYPLDRSRWRGQLPGWVLAAWAVTLLAEVVLLGVVSAALPVGFDAAYFLAMRSLGTLPVVGGAVALAHVVAVRERAERAATEAAESRAALTEARLDALADQLRPHFLFNTLQGISTLIHRDPDGADRMLGRLGELLRASLTHSRARVVPLAEELRLVEEYLAIARERFGERLVAEVRAEPSALRAGVPPFLLQPLVENAVRHGLEERRAGGRVSVVCRVSGGALVLEVSDDGAGIDRGGPPAERVGLGNTRERLRALYGSGQALTMEARPGGGATVRVSIPYRPAEDRP